MSQFKFFGANYPFKASTFMSPTL